MDCNTNGHIGVSHMSEGLRVTHAGHPTTIATQARMVFPFPYPSAAYIAGAKSGNPKPHIERRKATAARAEAAWRVKVSMTYVWIDWKFKITPAPTRAIPW